MMKNTGIIFYVELLGLLTLVQTFYADRLIYKSYISSNIIRKSFNKIDQRKKSFYCLLLGFLRFTFVVSRTTKNSLGIVLLLGDYVTKNYP